MADFDIAANLVLKQEGGYSNNPNDLGGETKFGIAKKFHPDVDLSTLTPAGAEAIYLSDYWLPSWAALSQNLANLMLSLSVNMGRATAVGLAQKALGVCVDGDWGHLTQGAALNTPDAASLIGSQAIRHYIALDKAEFLSGWITRVLEAVCAC